MEHIREELVALRGPASDLLIQNILQLAAQGGQLLDSVTCQPYPKTPLIDAFNVKLYSTFAFGMEHWEASALLAEQKGGLEYLSPGLAHPMHV
jgi:hypothetical protein